MAADLTWLADAGLKFDVVGPVATVTLARKERRNAMTPSMWHGLARIGNELLPADTRVVVVKGEGSSFCAGIDLRMFTPDGVPGEPPAASASEPDFEDQVAGYQAGFRWLRSSQFVSIAEVQSHAIGAGFQLALACDLRVVADDARFAMLEPSLGLVPDLGGTQPLADIVGYARALEICVTGRRVPAEEAERIGLVTSVVAPETLDEAVAALTAQLLAVRRDAVVETKALIAAAAGRSFADQERFEREAQVRLIRGLVGGGE